ncbi:hypothetical protein ACR52_20810 [Pseudomonas fildesensis]|uniref:Uncharacterized protein n=1 Tax=Pseudomonas fildesensis TaxID=1674920 RepID=A0A0J8FYM0_9PSED|nr:hypothetical protein ACR52_20810 [Pseudomonas fildesensis]
MNPAGNAFNAPPEQKPPQSINCMSGVCIARLNGMANMFNNTARQAIHGRMRFNEAMNEDAAKGDGI